METLRACAGRLLVAAWLSWFAVHATAGAACLAPPEAEASDSRTIAGARLAGGRLAAPVRVNGAGPFRFLIDTGSNRSSISPDLAASLDLPSAGEGDLHSVSGVVRAPLARVERLEIGGLDLGGGDLPVLATQVLGGEQGMLGVDGLSGRRLTLDFRRHCVEIADARRARRHRAPEWVTLRGQLRFGHLVIVEGAVGDVRVHVLIDTGAELTLGNGALRAALPPRYAVAENTSLAPERRAITAGAQLRLGETLSLPRVRLGEDLAMSRVTAHVGDFHVFALWGLLEEPALLIGMDVLSQADALAIDYSRAWVQFKINPSQRARR